MKRFGFSLALAAASVGCVHSPPKPAIIAPAPKHPNHDRLRALRYFFAENEPEKCQENKGPEYKEFYAIRTRLREAHGSEWEKTRYWDSFDLGKNKQQILEVADEISLEPTANPPIELNADEGYVRKKCGWKLASGCYHVESRGGQIESTRIYVYNGQKNHDPIIALDVNSFLGFAIISEEGKPIEILAHELGHSRQSKLLKGKTQFDELEANIFSYRLLKRWAEKYESKEGYALLISKMKNLEHEVQEYSRQLGKFSTYSELEQLYNANYHKLKIKKEDKDALKPYILADMIFVALIGHFNYDLDAVYRFIHNNNEENIRAKIEQMGNLPEIITKYRELLLEDEDKNTSQEYRQLLQDLSVQEVVAAKAENWNAVRKHQDANGHTVLYGVSSEFFFAMEFSDKNATRLMGAAIYSHCGSSYDGTGLDVILRTRPNESIEITPPVFEIEHLEEFDDSDNSDKKMRIRYGITEPTFPFPVEGRGFLPQSSGYEYTKNPKRQVIRVDGKHNSEIRALMLELVAKTANEWNKINPMDF